MPSEDKTNFHCELCSIDINPHDKENHLNGYKHKYKLRLQNSKPKVDSNYECHVCGGKFTNDEFYKIHIGSKKHRRNCKRNGISNIKNLSETANNIRPKSRKAVLLQESTNIIDYVEPTFYKSVKEKYRSVTKHREEQFQVYVNSLIGYWAVTLTANPSVKDFKFSVNNKDYGKFGDIVLEISYFRSPSEQIHKHIYAINIKYISSNRKQIDDVSNGKFNLTKLIGESVELQQSNDKIKYVIFTTATPSPTFKPKLRMKTDVFHKKTNHAECTTEYIDVIGRSLHNNDIINTVDDKENVFLLFSTDQAYPLPKVYVYTGQKKVKHFAPQINAAISKMLGNIEIEMHKEFIDFIEDWNNDLLGGSYKLNKEDILVTLGDLLLSQFEVTPEATKPEPGQNFTAWNCAVNSVDVTILQDHPFIIQSVCKGINSKFENEFSFTIDPNTKELRISREHLQNLSKELAMYLFEKTIEAKFDHVPLKFVYGAFWKAGLVPLLLETSQTDEQDFIMQVIAKLKALGLTRKYIVKIPQDNFKHLDKWTELSFFVNLDDVIHKVPTEIVDSIKIFISKRVYLNLTTIQNNDMYFSKSITTNEYFDLALGNCHFKQSQDVSEENGPICRLALSDEWKNILKEEFSNLDQVTSYGGTEKRRLRDIDPDLF